MLDHITAILRNQNYIVQSCIDSTKVLDILLEGNFHLVITDLEMPKLNGVELLRKIREQDHFLDLPIIGVSGTKNQDLISKLLKSGANDFLSKPFEIENLILKVDVTLTLHKKQRKVQELNEYLQDEIRAHVKEIRMKDQMLELENRHSQMGQMIGSLTRQWKQPLYGISLAADYIKRVTKSDQNVIDMVQTIKDQIKFLDDTMLYFKSFFKPTKLADEFNAIETIERVIELFHDTYEEIEFNISGDKNIMLYGHKNEFLQVFMNIFNNAQDNFIVKKSTSAVVTIW